MKAALAALVVLVFGFVVKTGLEADALYEKQLQAEKYMLAQCLDREDACRRYLDHMRTGRPVLPWP